MHQRMLSSGINWTASIYSMGTTCLCAVGNRLHIRQCSRRCVALSTHALWRSWMSGFSWLHWWCGPVARKVNRHTTQRRSGKIQDRMRIFIIKNPRVPIWSCEIMSTIGL